MSVLLAPGAFDHHLPELSEQLPTTPASSPFTSAGVQASTYLDRPGRWLPRSHSPGSSKLQLDFLQSLTFA